MTNQLILVHCTHEERDVLYCDNLKRVYCNHEDRYVMNYNNLKRVYFELLQVLVYHLNTFFHLT